jgi:dolichyl-phosphate-mannose-protein mannosyltransferase
MASNKGSLRGKSADRSPARTIVASSKTVPVKRTSPSYASDGIKDNDIFMLPGSDYQIMLALTLVATVVRLFRIYQPSSVVFDEVQ